MGYVMMPVPEEHVEAVMQFVLRAIAKASLEPWDLASATSLYDEVDEATRSLVAFVGEGSRGGCGPERRRDGREDPAERP